MHFVATWPIFIVHFMHIKNWKQHMFETNLYFVLLRHKLAYVKIKMLIDVDSYTCIYLGMNEIISFGECLKALRIV